MPDRWVTTGCAGAVFVLSALTICVGVSKAQAPSGSRPEISWETRAGGKMAFEVASVKPTKMFRPPDFPLDIGYAKTPGGRPVYALVLVSPGHTGPKLRPHSEGPPCLDFEMAAPFQPPALPKPGEVFPPGCAAAQTRGTREGTLVGGRDVTMEIIAEEAIHGYGSLVGEVDKPVIDQTALKGRYDYTLQLPPGVFSFSLASPNPGAAPADPTGTLYLDAVRKQLGLKLVSSRGQIRRLVVDHVDLPSGN